jgi:hypothetical protein
MAAETLTATRASSTFPVSAQGPAGNLKVGWGTYAVAAALEDGDIFEMHWVPDGCTIIGGWYMSGDMDTGTEALDNMAGWAANSTDIADPNGLMLANVLTGDVSVHLDVAGSFVHYGGVLTTAGPKTFSAGGGNTKIQVENNTAANTFGAVQMNVVTLYTVG